MKIEFRNVTHEYNSRTAYPQTGIRDISITLESGKIYALIGPTGSGKSTFIQHMNGLLLPTAGEIFVEDGDVLIPVNKKGKPLRGRKKALAEKEPNSYSFVPKQYLITTKKRKNKNISSLRKRIGVAFQFPEQQLFESTVLKDVAFGPRNYKIPVPQAQQLARNALRDVNISEDYFDRSPFDLSGGEQRKVAIAGILSLDPEFLVLDEPTAGLDPKNSKDILDLIVRLHSSGKTIVLITHDMEIALKYASEVIIFRDGQIVSQSSSNDLMNQLGNIDFIELPTSIRFAHDLKLMGYDVDLERSLDQDYLLSVIEKGLKV